MISRDYPTIFVAVVFLFKVVIDRIPFILAIDNSIEKVGSKLNEIDGSFPVFFHFVAGCRNRDLAFLDEGMIGAVI